MLNKVGPSVFLTLWHGNNILLKSTIYYFPHFPMLQISSMCYDISSFILLPIHSVGKSLPHRLPPCCIMILEVLCNERQKAIQHIVGPKGAPYMIQVESRVKFFETINGSKDNSKNGVMQPSQSTDAYTVQSISPQKAFLCTCRLIFEIFELDIFVIRYFWFLHFCFFEVYVSRLLLR